MAEQKLANNYFLKLSHLLRLMPEEKNISYTTLANITMKEIVMHYVIIVKILKNIMKERSGKGSHKTILESKENLKPKRLLISSLENDCYD